MRRKLSDSRHSKQSHRNLVNESDHDSANFDRNVASASALCKLDDIDVQKLAARAHPAKTCNTKVGRRPKFRTSPAVLARATAAASAVRTVTAVPGTHTHFHFYPVKENVVDVRFLTWWSEVQQRSHCQGSKD